MSDRESPPSPERERERVSHTVAGGPDPIHSSAGATSNSIGMRHASRWQRLGLWAAAGVCLIAACGWSLHVYRASQRRAAMLKNLPRVDVSKHDPEMARLISRAREGVVAGPFSGKAWGNLGSVLLAQELFLQAADCYAQAEQLDPMQVRWPYLRGLCVARIDRVQALECFRRAAERDKGYEFVDLPLFELLFFEGHVEEAESYLQRAARVAPQHPRVLLGFARIALVRGQLDDALQWATAAAKGVPPRRDIHLLICQIQQQRGDAAAVEEQMALLRRLPELPADNAWDDPFLAETTRFKIGTKWTLMVANELMTSGRAPEALDYLLQNGAEKSENFNMVLLLGRAYLQSDRVDEAKRSLERAMTIDPKYPTVHFELGNLAAHKELWNEAIEHYRKTLELDPAFGVAYLNIGVCERALGKSQAALESFRQACRQLPENAAAHYELAQLLVESNAPEEARKWIERAAELDPNDPRITLLLQRLQ